jgi:hypothetical protein
MTDHPRLTRYIPTFVGTDYAGMYKERAPGLYVPEQDPTHGPYVLAAESDAEIERLRAEIERLRQYEPLPGGVPLREVLLQREVERLTRELARYAYPPDHRVSMAEAERDRLRAEVERLRRQAAEWQPIETAPRGPACLFWVVPKSEEETWTDTSGWSITARGEPYIGMGPYGDWGSLWKATHWMRLPSAPTQASTDAPHCPTCGCGSEAPNTPAP